MNRGLIILPLLFTRVLHANAAPHLEPYVQDCIKHHRDTVMVPEFHDSENGHIRAEKVYQSNGRAIEVRMAFRVRYEDCEYYEKAKKLDQLRKMAMGCVREFYNRYGIDLIVSLNDADPGTRGTEIEASCLWGNINWIHWAWGLSDGITRYSCGIMIHEIGHHFGLPDEYRDPQFPDRWEGEPDSVMRNNHMDSRFYPRHLQAILRPYCGPRVSPIPLR